MPLSKARDKDRKRLERAKTRLDRLLCPPSSSETIQPKSLFHRDAIAIVQWNPQARMSREMMQPTLMPDLDADGNVIPNCW